MNKSTAKTLMLLIMAGVLWTVRICLGVDNSPPDFSVEAPPAWLLPSPFDLSKVDEIDYRKGDEIHFIFFDKQVRAEPRTRYVRVVKKLINSNGVQMGSKLELEFDPTLQSLTLHGISIRRGDRVINKLEREKIKIVQREKDLERHIYDGRVSAVLILEDTRAGDILDYSYSVTGGNPVFQNQFMGSFGLNWSLPVTTFRYRLLWPAGRRLNIAYNKQEHPPSVRGMTNGITEYIWEVTNSVPMEQDSEMPSWYESQHNVQLSEFDAWSDVVEWAMPLYEASGDLSAGLKRQVEEWIQSETNKEAIALSALRFVQDNIRYMGIEVGMNSHRPTHPDVVFHRRFGDCKDKVLLLTTMLKEADIEAYPVLVNSWNRYSITNSHPSPTVFNHVIAQIVLDGTNHWVDATICHQGGDLRSTYCPNYGFGLTIRNDNNALSMLPAPSKRSANSHTVKDTYNFTSCDSPGKLTVTTTYIGFPANRLRHDLEGTPLDELTKDYLNYYAGTYPNAKSMGTLQISDDRRSNTITVVEQYQIPSPWRVDEKKSSKSCTFRPYFLRDRIQKPDAPVRSTPLEVRFPFHGIHTIEVILPDMNGRDLPEFNKRIKNEVFDFKVEAVHQGSWVRIRYEYVSLRDHVEQKAIDDYVERVSDVRAWLQYEVKIDESAKEKVNETIKKMSRSVDELKKKRKSYISENEDKGRGLMMGMMIAIGVGVVILFVAHVFEKRKNKTGESK